MPEKAQIESMFDAIAPDYDRLNHIMSFGIDKRWRRRAVRTIADSQKPLRILDVASGTGDFAIAIAKKVHPESEIIGIDLSEKMLEVGRTKVPDNITLQQGDVEALAFPDDHFNRVSVAFGIRNFEHLEQGLSEMHRVLRPGGKMVILELSYPDNPFLLWCYKCYTLHILPFIGGLISGDRKAYTYLPHSILAFPKADVIVPMLENIGFGQVRVRRFTFGTCVMYVGEKMAR
ncbi:MAG: bifunctional demethylmenaquinone methyltransferase/2-methoxy-6-polyprenyl-1,4-benzoquinol methylase UbiE [Bacteroidales bacterium]|nr:bifunctional demethylmenaquinone methyltransferase/2-methoxy-6-polyprenyl-1,4-benzoquinol methylase UbiE [Bacteroidales bacterium]